MSGGNLKLKNKRLKKDYSTLKLGFFLALVAGLLFIACFGQYIVPYDPYAQDLNNALQAPSGSHLLGTDRYGRDLLTRIIVGAQTTIFSALALVAGITIIGTIVGIICGYVGGWIDSLLMRISDIFLAFPEMVFAIAIAGVLNGGIWSAAIAVGLIAWPRYARVARSQVLAMKNHQYMNAAKLTGTPWYKVIVKHIMPNIMGPIIVTAALDIGAMIMNLAGLSYLGLGVVPPTPEWGSMMSEGRSMLQTSPWVVLAPGLAIFITVVIFNLLGDTVRDILDPKQKRRSIKNNMKKVKNIVSGDSKREKSLV
ncbi:MAG: nickel transporter permease [Acutalibacteraceae bacterium]|nr:nickel transporter permease [Acutalibacteraceae bacterium]